MCIKKFYPRIKCQSVYCMKGLGCKESAMPCLWEVNHENLVSNQNIDKRSVSRVK